MSNSNSMTLEELAAQISDCSKALATFYAQSGYPRPDNDYNHHTASEKLLPNDAPDLVQQARHTLLEAAEEIKQRYSEPSEYLEQHQVNYQQLACLQWLLRFNILKHVSLTDPVPFTAVAASAGVPLSRLKSVARMAIAGGLLREPKPEYLAHSRISARFIIEPEFLDWACFMTDYSAPVAGRLADATERWGDTTAANETAYNIAMDTSSPIFEHQAQSKEASATFAGYMRSLGKSQGLSINHILNGFDWNSLGKAHIVDVGGSAGHASIVLARHHPQLNFTVQDLPTIIDESNSALSTLDSSIAERITFTAHDFFTSQRADIAASADVYFLRKILHDWPFEKAKLILQQIATVMKPDAKIIIMDAILPQPGSVSLVAEARMRVRDLTMAESFNSGERELSDWIKLFESSVPQLRLKDLVVPQRSHLAVMVVVKADDNDKSR